MNDAAPGHGGFGGFSIGALRLALPMTALREVVPFSGSIELPCPAAFVIGGICLRGVVVPVVDLRILLGRVTGPVPARQNVVVMVHGTRLVGLLADAVTGIFEAAAGSYMPVSEAGGAPSLLLAGVQRQDTLEPVSVLSSAALTALPQLPMVDDPEPSRRQQLDDGIGHDAAVDASVPMLLLQGGGVPFAIEAMAVHTTLSHVHIEPSALTSAHCRGVIAYDGRKIAAIDLLGLCGLGRLSDDSIRQAFVVRTDAGDVAFLVSHVIDVVRTAVADVKPVPAFALPRAGMFAGALPTAALGADLVSGSKLRGHQFLIIDAKALKSCDEVASLAALGVVDEGGAQTSATCASTSGTRAMITYMLATERATPLEQVSEILPYQTGAEIFGSSGAVRGLMMDRGRSIPVLCLAQSIGESGAALTDAHSVLVVELDGERIGFAVPALKSIENAEWEPVLPASQDAVAAPSLTRGPRALAMVGNGSDRRMLPMIDLCALAKTFRSTAGSTKSA